MTGPQPRNVRADAERVITNSLRLAEAPAPHFLAAKLLADLAGAHIGLVDRTPPDDPNADYHHPTNRAAITRATDAATDYQQAKAAIVKNRPTARRGLTIPRQCGCACVKGFCQCSADCACAPCPLCHPAPPEPQEGRADG